MTAEHNPQSQLHGLFDLVIIGGGALGCAMTWEAASRGLRVALIEKNDFGSGTSANSLRIVHGGLRYLQKLNIRRARASTAERSALLRIAPHLVAPLRCAIPTLDSWTRGRIALAGGLALNALLTPDRNRALDAERRLPPGALVSANELAKLAPGIPWQGSTGGACWYDALMLDAERLCLAFVLSAESEGAEVLNHSEAINVTQARNAGCSITIRNQLTGTLTEFVARTVADCRGTYRTKQTVGDVGLLKESSIRCVKAVNVVLDGPQVNCAVGFPSRNKQRAPIPGRLFFVVPFQSLNAVGTWYFDTDQTSDSLRLAEHELDQITDDLRLSTEWPIDKEQIRAVQVGLLPKAPHSTPADPLPIEEPSIFKESFDGGRDGIWRVQTEKWTMVRRLAETAIDTIAKQEALRVRPSVSRFRPLHGADFASLAILRNEAIKLAQSLVTREQTTRLTTRFGTHALEILKQIIASPEKATPVPGCPAITIAELEYVLTREMPGTLPDLVHRRLGLGATGSASRETLEFTANVMGKFRGWSATEILENLESVQRYPGFGMV